MGWTELSIGLFDCQTAHRTIQSGWVCLATIRYIFTLSPRSKFAHCWFPNALSPKSTLASRGSNCTLFFWRAPPVAPVLGDSPDFGLGMGVSIVFPDAVSPGS